MIHLGQRKLLVYNSSSAFYIFLSRDHKRPMNEPAGKVIAFILKLCRDRIQYFINKHYCCRGHNNSNNLFLSDLRYDSIWKD